MSTRTNIIIKDPDLQLTFYIYRHCDGYPAYVGKDILEIEKMDSATNAIRYLLTRENARYEITDERHGDIEHLYIVTVNNGGIRYGTGYGAEIKTATITREAFAEITNTDRHKINTRIDENYPDTPHLDMVNA